MIIFSTWSWHQRFRFPENYFVCFCVLLFENDQTEPGQLLSAMPIIQILNVIRDPLKLLHHLDLETPLTYIVNKQKCKRTNKCCWRIVQCLNQWDLRQVNDPFLRNGVRSAADVNGRNKFITETEFLNHNLYTFHAIFYISFH